MSYSTAKQIIIDVLKGKQGSKALNDFKTFFNDKTKYWYAPSIMGTPAGIYICNDEIIDESVYNRDGEHIGCLIFKTEYDLIEELKDLGQPKSDLIELPASLIQSVLEISNFI